MTITAATVDKLVSALLLSQAAERELCRRSFTRFLSHVIIPDPPPLGSGDVKFVQWPALMKLNATIDQYPVTFCLKSRKLGVTSLIEARFVHKAWGQRNSFFPVLSQGEKEAYEVIFECRYIWEHLPDYLRADLVENNKELLSFKNGGRIEAFPATAKAGRSFTGTEVFMDEGDFHPEFEASYNALLPLIQDTGGKLIVVSSANAFVADSAFRRKYQEDNASVGKIFLGYYDRPGRTEETFRTAELLSTDKVLFEKENARNEIEALSAPTTLRFFQMEPVEGILASCREPVEMRLGGLVRIWKPPVVAGKYIAGADTAWGQKGSYSCVAIADYVTGEQVAEIYGRPSSDELAQIMYDTLNKYNKAYLVCEANGENMQVVNKLIALGYGPRMYHRDDDWRDNERHRGFLTDGVTRPKILTGLEEAVRLRGVTPVCKDAPKEMMTFIRPKDHQNHPEASKGAYDDHVMAWALLWFGHGVARWETAWTGSDKPVVLRSNW